MTYLMAKGDSYDYLSKFGVVKNELITRKEYHKKCPYIPLDKFYIVQLNKNFTYKSFGVRFPVSDVLIHFLSDGKNFIFAGCGTSGKLYETILH